MGKILTVDLSTGRVTEEGLPPEEILKKYVGCYGLGLWLLYHKYQRKLLDDLEGLPSIHAVGDYVEPQKLMHSSPRIFSEPIEKRKAPLYPGGFICHIRSIP